MIKVVHCKKEKFDVYIGRKLGHNLRHFGNPWSHLPHASAILVDSRETAIENYRKWIMMEDFLDVEPQRRVWIRKELPNLKGKTLGCYCAPQSCHGDLFEGFIDKLSA